MKRARFILLALTGWTALAAEFHLRDGTLLRGELSNASLTVHSACGSISIPSTDLARIEFGRLGALDSVVTRDANRLSGFVNDSFQLEGRQPFTRADLAEITLAGVSPPAAARFVVLANGDLLSGAFTIPPILLTNLAGVDPLPAAQIDSLWFKGKFPSMQVQMADGRTQPAFYPDNTFNIILDAGPSVRLPGNLLKVVYLRPGSVPPEVLRLTNRSSENPRGSGILPLGLQPPPDHEATPPGMVWVPPGQVLLGSPLDERGRNSDEGPQTLVTITRGFWIAKYEVTQGEYQAVMGQNPSTFQGDTNRPVEKVSWHEAREYCARLTTRARDQGTLPPDCIYRLPTEAEWEYACRAGSSARFSFGADPDERELPNYAWFVGNAGWSTHPVGQLQPNPWGLYDMHGNVLEWCLGLWNDAYPGGQTADYNGPSEGWLHAARGGSWLYGAAFARSANRDSYGAGNRCSDLGFRVVLGAPAPPGSPETSPPALDPLGPP